MGLFFWSTHYSATSVLCLVVVLETTIIRSYYISLIIQSHKYVSCINFMWAVLIPSVILLPYITTVYTVAKTVHFGG